MDGRYARQMMLPEIGEEGQRRLKEASVLIVGLGGLGSAAAPYIVGAGVGRVGLADPDTVSKSNLHRQTLYDTRCVGCRKTDAAHERLSALSPATRFELFPQGITADNAAGIVASFDVVVDCCDNFPTRYLLDDVCAAAARPWVSGAIGPYGGQVTVFGGRSGRRYAGLYPDRNGLCSRPHRVAGVLGPVAGVVGALEAMETLKVIAGFGEPLDGRLLTVDMLTMQTETIYI